MARPKLAFRLHIAPTDFCDAIVNANIALANGEFIKVIGSYMEVLYKLSPGHVSTLLNRSMALLHCGLAELAVLDAHRASIAAARLRKVVPAVASLLTPDLEYAL